MEFLSIRSTTNGNLLTSMTSKLGKAGLDTNKIVKRTPQMYNIESSKYQFNYIIDLNNLSTKYNRKNQRDQTNNSNRVPTSLINFIDSREDMEELVKMSAKEMTAMLQKESSYNTNMKSLESNCVKKINEYSTLAAKVVSCITKYPDGHPHQAHNKFIEKITGYDHNPYNTSNEYKDFAKNHKERLISAINNQSRSR